MFLELETLGKDILGASCRCLMEDVPVPSGGYYFCLLSPLSLFFFFLRSQGLKGRCLNQPSLVGVFNDSWYACRAWVCLFRCVWCLSKDVNHRFTTGIGALHVSSPDKHAYLETQFSEKKEKNNMLMTWHMVTMLEETPNVCCILLTFFLTWFHSTFLFKCIILVSRSPPQRPILLTRLWLTYKPSTKGFKKKHLKSIKNI